MFFARIANSVSAPLTRRLRSLLLAGVAVAVGTCPLHAQDAELRGSVAEDVLAVSSPETLENHRLADTDSDALSQIEVLDEDFSSPVEENTLPLENEAVEAPAIVSEPQSAVHSSSDNARAKAIRPESEGENGRARSENPRAPAEQGGRITTQSDPFAPVGIRAGTFILRPSLEQGIRATSNGDNSSSGSSAVLSETTLRLNAQSDWSRHQATIDASGTLSKSISGQDVSEPRLDIQGDVRLDLDALTTVNLHGGYRLRRESASSPNGVTDAIERPLLHTFDGSLGIERDTGLLFGRATARIQHDMYGDAKLASGGSVSQKDRDNSYASIVLRSGFALSPALRPFAEVELGKRIFDERLDSNGYERSGTQYALRGGLMIDRGEKFNGELAAGFMRANSDDPRLGSISGPSIAAMLNWSPLRGTDVRLYAQTMVDTSTTPDIAGSLMHFASLDVTRRVRSDLSLNGRLDLNIRDNKDGTGTDYTIGAQIGATYWINRFLGLDARLRHERQTSGIADREYSSNSVYVGMKLQR